MKETLTLSESDGVRYLHFGTPWVQGAMRMARPFDLELDYVRDMMGWLLFLQAPRNILQLGLGAGALTKWCWKHLPETHTTVVEREASVVAACRQYFRLPPDDERLQVVMDDAASALTRPGWRQRFGVIQVDLYDAQARGPVCDSKAFYRSVWSALAAPGIVVVNLFGQGDRSGAKSLQHLTGLARGNVLAFDPTPAGNQVILAFKRSAAGFSTERPAAHPRKRTAAEVLGPRADWLRSKYRFEAHAWLRAALQQRQSLTSLGLPP